MVSVVPAGRPGGRSASSVHAVSCQPDRIDIFAVAQDFTIWTNRFDAGTWSGWPLNGGVAAPGATVFSASRWAGQANAFCIGGDFRVYAAWQQDDYGAGWHGFGVIDGVRAATGTSVSGCAPGWIHRPVLHR